MSFSSTHKKLYDIDYSIYSLKAQTKPEEVIKKIERGKKSNERKKKSKSNTKWKKAVQSIKKTAISLSLVSDKLENRLIYRLRVRLIFGRM